MWYLDYARILCATWPASKPKESIQSSFQTMNHPSPWNLVEVIFLLQKLPDKVACVVSEHSGGELFSDRNVMWVQQWLCLSRNRTGLPSNCAPCDALCCK